MKATDPVKHNEQKTLAHLGAVNHQRYKVAKIRVPEGSFRKVRILFDIGSQTTFITEACAQRFSLAKAKHHLQFLDWALVMLFVHLVWYIFSCDRTLTATSTIL